MAEIDIERKRGAAWLWWLLGLIGLILLAWMLLGGDGDDAEGDAVSLSPASGAETPATVAQATDGRTTDGQPGATPALQEFLSTCAPRAAGEMGLEHQYTSDCIRRLIGSVESVLATPALSGVNARDELEAARQSAERLSSSGETAEHATMTREALTSIAALIERVQAERFPALADRAAELRHTAQGIQPSTPLLDQRSAVQNYFRQAGDLLNNMATGA